ncbi:MAG: GGDEF domain-containing protein [Gammaproteobacteria bacterium]
MQMPVNPAVLFLDLDKFKEINDGIGHDVGDAVLRTIAERLRARVPNNAAIGRWGGDEFVVIIDGNYEGEAAESLAIGLRESLVPAIDFTGEPLHVGVSIGIAYAPIHGNSAMAIIRAADLAAAEVSACAAGAGIGLCKPVGGCDAAEAGD